MRVAINGLGRIGRALFKILMANPELEVAAVNDLTAADNLAYLLNHDTVYGRYANRVTARDHSLFVADRSYPVLAEPEPSRLPWARLGVDLVFECTGRFNRRNELATHLDAGAKRVMLSAPAADDEIPTVVFGVNAYDEKRGPLLSCASCTTNCVAPIVEIIGRRVGLRKAIMNTVHGYTASQGLVDGPNPNMRRGRAAHVLPELRGRFQGTAVRAPVPICSLCDVVVLTERRTSVEEINGLFLEEARSERYEGVVGVTEDPVVSSDIIQDPRASIVDREMTQVVDGDLVKWVHLVRQGIHSKRFAIPIQAALPQQRAA